MNAFATLNGAAIRRGEIVVPVQGAWWADVMLASDAVSATSGPAAIETATGLTPKGTVRRGQVYEGGVEARIVGGAGGLGLLLPARHYRKPSARLVAGDICAESGETLGTSSILDTELNAWSRKAGAAGTCLALLAEKLGVEWRISLAGEVIFGAPTWADSGLRDVDVYSRDPANACAELARFVEPGQTVLGERVTRSTISISESGSVTYRAHFGHPSSASQSVLDRLKGSLMAFIRGTLARVDHFARYGCTVVQQATDGTLELRPDDTRIAPLSGVPIKTGLPGASVKVPKGARVLLGWENGDPSIPYADLWESGTAMTEIAFDGGGQGIARVGDVVSCTIPIGTPFAGELSGSPFAGAFTAPVQVVGTILTGSPKLKN